MFNFVNIMKERLHLILKTKNISASKFADEIGVQKASISHIISGRNKPSLDIVMKILKRYPDIRPEWLLLGKGPMIYSKTLDLFDDIYNTKSDNLNYINEDPKNINHEDLKSTLDTSKKIDNVDLQNSENENKKKEFDNIMNQKDNDNTTNQVKLQEDIATSEEQNNIKTFKKENRNNNSIINSEKEIDKIIIFYTDHTFSWYNPIE